MTESSLMNKAEASIDVDVSVVKVSSFIGLTAVFAAAAGYFIAKINSPGDAVWMGAFLAAFLVLSTLQVFFLKNRGRIIIAITVESLAMFLPIAVVFWSRGLLWQFGLSLCALFTILLAADFAGRHELVNSLRIPFWRVAKNSLAKSIPAVLVFIALVYIFIAGQDIVGGNTNVISEYIVLPVVKTYLPDFTGKTTANDLFLKLIERQVGTDAFAKLSSTQKSAAAEQIYKNLKSYIGDFKTGVPIGSAIYQYFSERLKSSSPAARIYIALILISLIWFTIKTVSWILFMPLILLSLVFYELSLALNFAVLKYESRSREIILLE